MIYGAIATTCGYTWPQIDAMLWPDYLELAAFWQQNPPAHQMLAILTGAMTTWKRPESPAGRLQRRHGAMGPEEFDAMLKANGGKI